MCEYWQIAEDGQLESDLVKRVGGDESRRESKSDEFRAFATGTLYEILKMFMADVMKSDEQPKKLWTKLEKFAPRV